VSYQYERRQRVRQDAPGLFAFFKRPENLARLTPPWLHFRLVRTSDPEIREGTRIRYRLRLHGIPFSWESLITDYVENVAFADVMVAGPYRSWRHRHEFNPMLGVVEMRDLVRYELPFGPLGRLAHPLVRRQLVAIFDYRALVIERLFGAFPMRC
jgi:ligand-binding SRPBCC domain-containing protein